MDREKREINMETILFTGASGYLGRAVLKRLAGTNRFNIAAVTSRKMPKNGNGGGNGKRLTF